MSGDTPVGTEHVNLAHAREEHQRAIMQRIIEDGVCPFCPEHFLKYHTKPILAEDTYWVLTENFAPYPGAKYHYLLVSRVHSVGFWELSAESKLSFFAMLDHARTLAKAQGGTLIMRWGDTEYTGASVAHLHAQLVIGTSRTKGGEPILTSLGYREPNDTTPPE